jgi:hypothetical protein
LNFRTQNFNQVTQKLIIQAEIDSETYSPTHCSSSRWKKPNGSSSLAAANQEKENRAAHNLSGLLTEHLAKPIELILT